jgi:hypothetical protein
MGHARPAGDDRGRGGDRHRLALIVTARQGWPSVGRFLSGADVYGVTGILAAVAALLGLGGLFTVRRLAV